LKYSKTTLHLLISYYITFKSFFLINQINSNQKIISLKKTKKTKFFFYKTQNKKPKNRLKLIKQYKKIINTNNYTNVKNYQTNNFAEKLLESLTLFTENNKNIRITFQNLNKSLSFRLDVKESKILKKVLFKFRKEFKQNFFKETINILLICINKKNSAQLLSESISYQLSKLTKAKRHRAFLIFLKRVLIALSKTDLFKIKGIKIIVKGRFNGVPRARKQILLIGKKVPLQSFDSKIDYYQSNSYTANGTFGVKSWICEN
jgi:hypothetical protein